MRSRVNFITVIVPIYNAPEDLKNLCDSLAFTYPNPAIDLRFIFSDDCSPNPRIAGILNNHELFSRSDVSVIRTPSNYGFIRNVNFAISQALADNDLVLLNSDTEIFGDVFRTLRREAYAYGKTGSVTPFSNKATIASIFSYAGDDDLPKGISSRVISEVVEKLNLPTDSHAVPTGHGYCMYVTREAINAVGVLDEVFGRGYGEECDWCRRAHKAGFKSVITPKAFVHHSGTKSFLPEEKLASIRTGSRILNSRHPEYDRIVADYVATNPYQLHRLAIWLSIAGQTSQIGKLALVTQNTESYSGHLADTKPHSGLIARNFLQIGYGVVEIQPTESGYLITVRVGESRLGSEIIPFGQWELLLTLLTQNIDCLFIHDTMNWRAEHLLKLSAICVPVAQHHSIGSRFVQDEKRGGAREIFMKAIQAAYRQHKSSIFSDVWNTVIGRSFRIWVELTGKSVDDSIKYHIDAINDQAIEGWLFSQKYKSPSHVIAVGDHVRLGGCQVHREDVAKAFNTEEGINRCGFRVPRPKGNQAALYFLFSNFKSVKLPLR